MRCNLGDVGWGGGNWIELAQGKNKYRVLVNEVMNLRNPKMLGI
jgi:hypothetical protein